MISKLLPNLTFAKPEAVLLPTTKLLTLLFVGISAVGGFTNGLEVEGAVGMYDKLYKPIRAVIPAAGVVAVAPFSVTVGGVKYPYPAPVTVNPEI
jgi:hypothetical protein